ncbi:MAG: hypothetical protein NTY47_05980, partial [Candidatus Omnitrophica bacterium]|nr:hypothetical protein [Candidatus Omnitrophota bacterium]
IVDKIHDIFWAYRVITSDKDSKVFFVAAWNSLPFPGETCISRMDPFKEKVDKEFVNVGTNAPGIFKYISSIDRIIYRNSDGGPLLIIEGNSGKTISKIDLKVDKVLREVSLYKQGGDIFAIIGNKIINISKGVIVNSSNEFYPMGPIVITEDGKYAFYVTEDKSLQYTKIICYDLVENKIYCEYKLSKVGCNWGQGPKDYIGIHQLFLTPDGMLLALGGDKCIYDDHMHVFDKDELWNKAQDGRFKLLTQHFTKLLVRCMPAKGFSWPVV